jgi:excinuclease UvrABC nuclease subunit
MLPETPGVYLFKDAAGDLLYVGKARNIRSRVKSYFIGIDTHPVRIRRLARAVRDVDFIPTPSELSALVLESRLIKSYQPRYNRAEVRYRNLPFIRVDRNDRRHPVSWSFEIHPDGAEYFGPLQNRSQAEMLVRIARRYPTVFSTGIEDVVSQIEVEMQDAAERLEFERAGEFRDEIAFLGAFAERPYRAGFSVLDHNAVWIERSENREECTVLSIQHGLLASDLTVSVPMTDADRETLRRQFEQSLENDDHDDPSPYRRREIDEIRVIASWLYRKRERLEVVPVVSDDSTGDVLDRVEASIGRAS